MPLIKANLDERRVRGGDAKGPSENYRIDLCGVVGGHAGSLKAPATAEALRAILVLDLDKLSAIEPPRGFGRD
jgi:hypothetical protein